MKVVILCGGRGTRIGEETESIPKPMIEIGGRPLLWHIMKLYSYYGFNEFVLCLGYKGYVIKDYFANYFLHNSHVMIDLARGRQKLHATAVAEPWKIMLVDTGLSTGTGGRLRAVRKYIGKGTFMFTYGDGLSDVNIHKLVQFHKDHGKLATITAVQPLGRFGALDIGPKDHITSFQEKPRGDKAWINGGFCVLDTKVIDHIETDQTGWEGAPVNKLAQQKQLMAYKHDGFWKPLDTTREKLELQHLWDAGDAPWKVWKDKD